MPPVNVRLATFINDNLGYEPIIGGYTQIPAFTYLEKGIEDDLNFHNCDYLDKAKDYYYELPSSFVNYTDLVPIVAPPFCKYFKIDDFNCPKTV